MTKPLRYLSWIVTVPLAIIVISFAVSNRDPAVMTLWPLPFEVEIPIFLPVLGMLVLGFIAGGAIAWWSGGRYRRLARRQSARLRKLTDEVEALRARQADTDEAETRTREARRLAASTQASESAARQEEASAPKQLTSAGPR